MPARLLEQCNQLDIPVFYHRIFHPVPRHPSRFGTVQSSDSFGRNLGFFKRKVLEKLGRWDAQNVTEDADLGLRLHRLGYRCLWSNATTFEEANFRVVPWVRQRSRWLKGFLLTWMIHMRHPIQMFKQLGFTGFLVFQVQMLGTVSSFTAVPIVLPMWLFTIGFRLPLYDLINPVLFTMLIISFVTTEIFLLILGVFAVKARGGGSLYAYIPMMLLYWPLGAFAAYKAIW